MDNPFLQQGPLLQGLNIWTQSVSSIYLLTTLEIDLSTS
jgi:hypothetical protein